MVNKGPWVYSKAPWVSCQEALRMKRDRPDRRMIGELLRNPNTARVRHVERGLAAAGHPAIRQPHLPVFEYLDRERGSRITYLAQQANITVQAMGELVDYL